MFTQVSPSRFPALALDEQDTEFSRSRAGMVPAAQTVFRTIGEALGRTFALQPASRTRRDV